MVQYIIFSFERNMNLTLKLRGKLYKYWHGFSKAHDKGILSAKSGQVLLASCEGNGDFVSEGARTRPKPCLLNPLLKFYRNTLKIFNQGAFTNYKLYKRRWVGSPEISCICQRL